MALGLRAWFDLGSCRGIGMALGPIPWTAMLEWVRYKRLSHELGEIVIAVVQQLDGERAAKADAKRRMEALKTGVGGEG